MAIAPPSVGPRAARHPSPLQTAVHVAQYAGARCFSWLFGAFPPEQNLRTAGVVADTWASMNPRRVARASGNIRRSLPNLTDAQCHDLALASVRYMFRTYMVDAFQLPRLLNAETWPQYVDISNAQRGVELMMRECPSMYLAPHAGNWELLGFFPTIMGFRMHALARPLDNPFLWKWALGLRESRGMRIVSKFGATEELTRIVERGGRVAFIADQNAGQDGLFVPFFGQMASAYKSIGLLAMRYQLPIAVGVALRVGDGFRFAAHTIDVIHPADWEPHDDPLFYITARYNRAMEQAVLLAPDQYLWIHRRWNSRPKWEREGKPLPDRVKAKLRALPWMTDDEMSRLEADTLRRGAELARSAA
ncbi:MAG: lysophospholipid acyltransferase family protein [Phycisphaerae bacterium]|nr:lysophospholipid acyltransferase family protein [Phycisphaerae bacterium]